MQRDHSERPRLSLREHRANPVHPYNQYIHRVKTKLGMTILRNSDIGLSLENKVKNRVKDKVSE